MPLTFAAGDDLRTTEGNAMIIAARGQGVYSGGAVTQRALGANMSVDVATFVTYFVDESDANRYRRAATGPQNVVIAASDPTNDRYDIITVLRTAGSPFLVATTGTAGANPFPPAIPANSILLAIVRVPAGATSIVNANIRDGRIFVPRPPLKTVTINNSKVTEAVSAKTYTIAANTFCEVFYVWADVWLERAVLVGGASSATLDLQTGGVTRQSATVNMGDGNSASNVSDTSGSATVVMQRDFSQESLEGAVTVDLDLVSTGSTNILFLVEGI